MVATNYSKVSRVSSNYSVVENVFFLLLQNGDFLLLQNGSKLVLESSPQKKVNYTKPTRSATNYS